MYVSIAPRLLTAQPVHRVHRVHRVHSPLGVSSMDRLACAQGRLMSSTVTRL